MITKTESELLIRDLLDDADSKRWSASVFPLWVSAAMDSVWGELLTDRPYYNSQMDNISTLTSPGYVDLSSGGDLSQRFGRIQSVTRSARQYSQARPESVVLEDGAVVLADDYTYTKLGDELHLFPYDTTTDVEVRYCYLPAKWSSLSGGDDVVWPDGHEMVYIHHAASIMGGKGGVEDVSAMFQIKELLYQKMLAAIKPVVGPLTMHTNDTPEGWGGR